jgi:hypothetical protein
MTDQQQMWEQQSSLLRSILDKYGTPDPKIVNKLPKGGITLDFVGHADVTKTLIEVDPLWTWQPVAWDDNGMPKIHVANGVATMWGIMTVHGKQMLGVATVQANKPDLYKELASDFIRNAAMRFGLFLSLWTKSEWEDASSSVGDLKSRKIRATSEVKVVKPVDAATIAKFIDACREANIDHDQVASHAGVDLSGEVTTDDLVNLRNSFKALKEASK